MATKAKAKPKRTDTSMGRELHIRRDAWETKHRPKVLADVYGQPGAVAYLQGLIDSRELPSSILFVGSTGQGKTTMARAFAAAINGRKVGASDKPSEDSKSINDYYEHDFGSESSKDDVRLLMQRARMLPQKSGLSIMTLDEFHSAATKQSYNPFLKTFEEPPETTLFLMTTDQPERLPPAILSRCKKVVLKGADVADTGRLLLKVAKREEAFDLFADKKSITRIAELCGGQPRESLQALQSIVGVMRNGGKYNDALQSVLRATQNTDLVTAVNQILLGLYIKKPKLILKGLGGIDSFHGMIAKALEVNKYWLEACYGGNPYRGFDRVRLIKAAEKKGLDLIANPLPALEANARLVKLRERMNAYAVNEFFLASTILISEPL